MGISVIGLGKLGLCTAACFAAKGHRVIGFDKNRHITDQLNLKHCPIDETGLAQLLDKAWQHLVITADIQDTIFNSEITFVVVPTPSLDDGRFTNEYVDNVLRSLAPVVAKKQAFHVIVIVSTVMPGSCELHFKPLLENLSGKQCGKDFGLVYNPEFIALGSVIKDFLNPDMVLIGASDRLSAKTVEKIYRRTCDNNPKIKIMSLINAEITKLSLNCFVTTKISFANELASICEQTPGAKIDVITDALGSDTRIGPKYLKAGLGFGGPCFPRDNLAFQAFARDMGIEAKLAPSVVAVNQGVIERLFNLIQRNTNPGEKVAILGLSYKPFTHITEESQSVILAKKLAKANYVVAVHDPKALQSARAALGNSVSYFEDLYACTKNASAIVLMTKWPIYEQLDWTRINKLTKEGALILDSWRIASARGDDNLHILSLGNGPCS